MAPHGPALRPNHQAVYTSRLPAVAGIQSRNRVRSPECGSIPYTHPPQMNSQPPLPPPPAQPSAHQKRLRQSHRKSRTGCGNCKKRRIKVEAPKQSSDSVSNNGHGQCDETNPECKNCGAFGARCDYVSDTAALQDAPLERSLFLNIQRPRQRGKRVRPRTRWDAQQPAPPPTDGSSPSRTGSTSPLSTPLSRPAHSTPSDSPGYADEIRLLHHYLTREYEGTAIEPPTHDALRLQAPTLGLSYPFVLYLVYEFAALDFARLQPRKDGSTITHWWRITQHSV
ncbi:hypothetical protein B0J12DRAFT_774186 [Macrophomina phaseolina]|uniref:Zn(2)-C6 fungal-type domain-containing protein n=1 Tax=Macrophomina phaseolina TaxID=35725 RepID=A0ABQ8FS46_9PEZI|nr:hypothetical protein B0J12DRAFT_774186 [Macrophomina phaseolina]